MRLRSLFSGIEGFGLGFQIVLGSKVEIIDQAEIDPFAIRVLEARYPNVPRLPDVRLIDAGAPPADVLTAGFPCQPVSQAGPNNTKGRSYADDVRWLWPEVYRIMAATRPPLVLVENVRGLLRSGMREVVVGLAELGYAAQWDLIPAAAVGAPHLRHRVWIVAYPEEAPIGRVFERTPPVFAWPDETAALPRLARDIPDRKGRLSALGNAVVPECVAYLALEIALARLAEPLIPAGLFGVDPAEGWNGSYPVAGALLGGMLYEETTVAPKISHRLWPTPVQVAEAVERGIWPTPTTSSALTAKQWSRPGERLWPTPSRSDGSGGRISSQEVRETGRRASGAKAQRTLGDAATEAERFWPTPKASPSGPDYARAGREESGGDDLATAVARDESKTAGATSLNPRWVEWLMGYPLGWTEVE